jgi:protein subunit release factor B
MDWAAMVMNMYRSWAQRRGYTVTVVEEMPGEVAGIKVIFLTSGHEHTGFCYKSIPSEGIIF